MEFFKHRECNFVFTAPPGTEDECDELWVRTDIDPTFGPVSTSFWRLSKEDMARLNAGGSIALNIFATGHPVVSMSTVEPE